MSLPICEDLPFYEHLPIANCEQFHCVALSLWMRRGLRGLCGLRASQLGENCKSRDAGTQGRRDTGMQGLLNSDWLNVPLTLRRAAARPTLRRARRARHAKAEWRDGRPVLRRARRVRPTKAEWRVRHAKAEWRDGRPVLRRARRARPTKADRRARHAEAEWRAWHAEADWRARHAEADRQARPNGS